MILDYVNSYVNMQCHRILKRTRRLMSTLPSSTPRISCHMPSRTLIHVHGIESTHFLQGLLTNDIENNINSGDAVFTHLLNNKGRAMFEAFVAVPNPNSALASNDSNVGSYLLECHVDVVPKLMRHLKMHKLRSKVKITNLTETHDVWWSSHGETEATIEQDILCSFNDPRATTLGHRTFTTKGTLPMITINEQEEENQLGEHVPSVEAAYNMLRLLHGALEGTEVDGVIPLEVNLDLLNGVVFDKGCYLGQELTARTHYRGLLRKRCFPVVFNNDSNSEDDPQQAFELSPTEAQHIAYGNSKNEIYEIQKNMGIQYNQNTVSINTTIKNNGKKRAGKILTDHTMTPGNVGIALLRLEHVTGVSSETDSGDEAQVPERLLTVDEEELRNVRPVVLKYF